MTILTMGHSTLPIKDFLQILGDNGAPRVVDVRSIPHSRQNPQFDRRALISALVKARVPYHWMPSLGGLRPAMRDSVNVGWRSTSFRGYADYMQSDEFAGALEELIALASVAQVCLLCAEAVPWRCHRSLLADALTARGLDVEHIMYKASGDSTRNHHSLPLFAQIDGSRVWYPARVGDLFSMAPTSPGD